MSNELCRVTIEENQYQNWLTGNDDSEQWYEDAAMEQYYDEKYGDDK